jgi:hypothetical protein
VFEPTKEGVESIVSAVYYYFDMKSRDINLVCIGITDMLLQNKQYWHNIKGPTTMYLPNCLPRAVIGNNSHDLYYYGPLETQGVGKQNEKNKKLFEMDIGCAVILRGIDVNGKYILIQYQKRIFIAKGQAYFYGSMNKCTQGGIQRNNIDGGGFELWKKIIVVKIKCTLDTWQYVGRENYENEFDFIWMRLSWSSHATPKEYIKPIHKTTIKLFEDQIKLCVTKKQINIVNSMKNVSKNKQIKMSNANKKMDNLKNSSSNRCFEDTNLNYTKETRKTENVGNLNQNSMDP